MTDLFDSDDLAAMENDREEDDVFIKDMEARPTLITNLLQYTPAKYVINIIDGSNYRKQDPLFGDWG